MRAPTEHRCVLTVLRPVLDLADKFASRRVPQQMGSCISQEAYFDDGTSIEISVRDNNANAVLYDYDGKVLANLFSQGHFGGEWKISYGFDTYVLNIVPMS